MVDLDQEGEHLLDLLFPAEELQAAVPALCTASDGEGPVLIGITDRRALVIGRWRGGRPGAGLGLETGIGVDDVTTRVAGFVRGAPMVVADGGSIVLDLDDHALDRLWRSMDELASTVGVG